MSEATIKNTKCMFYQKILAVQKVLEPLDKTGWNDFQKYSYSTASDVLLPVKLVCNEHGLIILADCVASSIEPGRATVTVKLTVVDSETGESLSVTAPGYAEDFSHKDRRPNGDKAVYKAITGATKYAVRSCFCLPSDDDPERTPNKFTVKTIIKPAVDNSKANMALIEQTNVELKRLGWSTERGRLYLQQTFGKSSRQQLTEQELQEFLNHLCSLQPTGTQHTFPKAEGNAPMYS